MQSEEVGSQGKGAPRAMDMAGLGPLTLVVVGLFSLMFSGPNYAYALGQIGGRVLSAAVLALPLYMAFRYGTKTGRSMVAIRLMNIFCLLVTTIWGFLAFGSAAIPSLLEGLSERQHAKPVAGKSAENVFDQYDTVATKPDLTPEVNPASEAVPARLNQEPTAFEAAVLKRSLEQAEIDFAVPQMAGDAGANGARPLPKPNRRSDERDGGAAPLKQDWGQQTPPQSSRRTDAPNAAGASSEAMQAESFRRLALMHPDWKAVDNDPAFAAFNVAQGPEYMQRLMKASSDYDYIFVGAAISRFKASRRSAIASTPPPK